MDNIQHMLNRVRSPRVQITYDVETNGATVLKEIPYIITILSDVIGDSNNPIKYHERKFVQLNGNNINDLMKFWDVRVKTMVNKWKGNNDEFISLDIPLHGINDFHPDHIIENIELLNNLKQQMILFKEMKRKLLINNNFLQSLLVNYKTLLTDGNDSETSNGETKNNKK